ncbi:MAG: hypothetical protein IPG53_17330 [Ignavibacteriales bacterium]|nr:hypothetical protein [Ignavibacteriales bacterium]
MVKIVIDEDIPFFDPDKHDLLQKVPLEKLTHWVTGNIKSCWLIVEVKPTIVRCLMSRDAIVIRVPWNHDFSNRGV